MATDSAGNVLNDSLYFPYGQERIIAQTDTANNYRYSGKELMNGLSDFGARFYASDIGRFMTPDWDGKPAAVPYANFGDPQTLNLYSYVENGPLNKVDADGHSAVLQYTSLGSESGIDPPCPPNCDDFISTTKLASLNPAYEANNEANGGQTSDKNLPSVEKPAQQQNQNLSPTDKAALKAETAALGPTRESVEEKNSHEYGGLIVRNNKNGRISSTDPVRGNGISIDVDSIPVPAGTTVIATYHSHPHSSAVEDGGASQGDVNNSAAHNNRPGYVLDSFSGRVYRYDGHTDARPFPAGTYIGTVQ